MRDKPPQSTIMPIGTTMTMWSTLRVGWKNSHGDVGGWSMLSNGVNCLSHLEFTLGSNLVNKSQLGERTDLHYSKAYIAPKHTTQTFTTWQMVDGFIMGFVDHSLFQSRSFIVEEVALDLLDCISHLISWELFPTMTWEHLKI